MSYAVLIVEDEEMLARNLRTYLERHGHEARVAGSAEEALVQIESFKPDVMLLDFHLPGMNGLDMLARLRSEDRSLKVVMLTGHGSVQLAVDAMKAGAYDFLTKPVALGKLKLLLDKALGEDRREEALSYYLKREAGSSGLDRMFGESLPMRTLKETIAHLLASERALADADAPAVLIAGETGSGKELVARALHFDGPRSGGPFIELNCSSIPAHLLESELFGYERGAFTDARERKLGLVEAADGGTLFLDEIGDIEPGLQAKLLKLIEEKTVRRLGGLREHKVNVRFVTATHRSLETLVREGKFRADLFYRLRVVQLVVPPLRERGDDVLRLARQFLDVHAARYGRRGMRFSAEAESLLRRHDWPGNVRELRNAVEQAVLLARGEVIETGQLPFAMSPAVRGTDLSGPVLPNEGVRLETVERDLILRALEKCGGNVTRAARFLGLTRDTLRYRIEKYDLMETAKSE